MPTPNAPDKIVMSSGPWNGGMDSMVDPIYLPDNKIQWSDNTINRGVVYQTRPGFQVLHDQLTFIGGEPRGMTIFTPLNGDPVIVKAIGGTVMKANYPYTTWEVISGITLAGLSGPVVFETAVKSVITLSDETLFFVDPPVPMLFISDGLGRVYSWDGTTVVKQNPNLDQTPPCTAMKWVGNRLWCALGPKIVASNLGEPDKFLSDNSDLVGNGAFYLPADCTGLGVTPNFQQLLAFTSSTTTSFQAYILDRAVWGSTPNFQQVILSNIGCVAQKSIHNQYGMTWWYSESGLINLDEALLSFRTSKLHLKDEAMARSKANFSDDISGICIGSYGNFMMVSVPSGDKYNAHTWIMDGASQDSGDGGSPAVWTSVWKGIRPIEWVTYNIKGKTRCFALSRDDYEGDILIESSNVWEAFCPSRYDVGVNISGELVKKEIRATIETKYLSNDSTFKKYGWSAYMLSEAEGTVILKASIASRHSGYIEVMNKQIIATTDVVNQEQVSLPTILTSRLRQTRFVRSALLAADSNPRVENEYTQNKDKGFFLLIDWTGELAIDYALLYCDPAGDPPVGKVEPDETGDRWISVDSTTGVLSAPPLESTVLSQRQTGNFNPVSSRSEEIIYFSTS